MEPSTIERVAAVLSKVDAPMKARYRALFTLRNLGGKSAIDAIAANFSDDSNLLKHELAYCLGQMQDDLALDVLRSVVKDESQHVIVRHEAAEALGAIGRLEDAALLEKYTATDTPVELAETCRIAVDRISWLSRVTANEKSSLSKNPYNSVDPAPPFTKQEEQAMSVEGLTRKLLDADSSLFDRYRAMFSLRNMCTEESVLAITKGFEESSSALFRHEIAYVLGQLSHPASEAALTARLRDTSEHGMVRHECAEALGSVALPSCMDTLREYVDDEERLVRESCEVALDMCEYELNNEFQYANTAVKLSEQTP